MIDKNNFRQHCMQRLKRARGIRKYKKDSEVVKKLNRLIQSSNARTVLLYLPLKMEVNMYPLIVQLRKQNRVVYVPFMEGKSFRLVKYRLPLRQKQFGIKEPNDSKQYRNKTIDLAIVPIVGVDATLRRVGFGKGMYDRFFEKEKKNIKKVVFVARELCYAKEVITNHYDVKADIIITP